MYSVSTVSMTSKFDEIAQENTKNFSRTYQDLIGGIRELLDVECRITGCFVGWWLAPWTLKKGHKELMPLQFSLFHRSFFTIYSALSLTVSGFYEAARPLLRNIFESLMISKFCDVCDDDSVMKKWDSGETVYFANSILKKIEVPDPAPFSEFWNIICEHSHATKASGQPSIELKDENEEINVPVNLAVINALLECNYHLLNTHLITPELNYMHKFYSNSKPKVRDYETPELRKRAHVQFKKDRIFLNSELIKLIYAYKKKWVIKRGIPTV